MKSKIAWLHHATDFYYTNAQYQLAKSNLDRPGSGSVHSNAYIKFIEYDAYLTAVNALKIISEETGTPYASIAIKALKNLGEIE